MLVQAAIPAQATPPQRLLLLAIPSSNATILPKTASRAPCTCCRYQRLEVREVRCSARRRARYEEEEEGGEEYGHNEEIAMLESYTESARSEALLVRATVDGEEELVLIFKGFSSCLSARTASDPSKSVLPARAIIQSIDVVKGPFDPSNIQVLEKGLTWGTFKARLVHNKL